MRHIHRYLLFLFVFVLAACGEPREVLVTPGPTPDLPTREIVTATPVLIPGDATPITRNNIAASPSSSVPTPTLGPTATLAGDACGQRLPLVLPLAAEANLTWRTPPVDSGLAPQSAVPAIRYLFENPEDVALVVYQVGYEGIGFFHNADQPMPLASVSKLVQLVAYGDAIESGYLNPNDRVDLAILERYYLPRSDLGSHNRALDELDSDNLILDDLIWMMLRYSANSAVDYLHDQVGQATIEQTVLDLDLGAHTAPCTFLGRFLAMTAPAGYGNGLSSYRTQPGLYGEDVVRLAELYVNDEQFRERTQDLWSRRGGASVLTQTDYVDALETRGTARGYAALMGGLANGTIGTEVTNPLMRQHLEWPLEAFAINAERYRFVGYKNGTLPGVLTTAYYAWPYWSESPIVVTLFYKDLPNSTYQSWRRTLPQDSFAHWLMSDPNAIHIMHVWRDTAAGG